MADFAKLRHLEEYDKLAAELADLDVALLILNAGYCVFGPLEELNTSEVESLIQVNAVQISYFTKAMSKQLLSRRDKTGKKAAVMTVGSQHSSRPNCGFTGYSAAKMYVHHLTDALSTEFAGKIDCTYFQPAYIATKMISRNTWSDPRVVTPEVAADRGFRDLGLEKVTNGALRHEVFGWYFQEVLPL